MLSKKTKILATIGPASDNIDTIERMVMAGVNAFRMNFSHGTHEYHKSNLDKIRAVEAKLGRRYFKISVDQKFASEKSMGFLI